MFRIQGGPGDASIPLIAGVDEFVSKAVLWTLGCADAPTGEPWHLVPPDDLAAMLDPAFAHVRADVAALGGVSKFDRAHVAEKWSRVCEKIAAERAAQEAAQAQTDALLGGTSPAAADANAEGMPLVIQLQGRYYVRVPGASRYVGPQVKDALIGTCRDLWRTAGIPLDVPAPKSPNGSRAMTDDEIVKAYGRQVYSVAVDLTVEGGAARVTDLGTPRASLVIGPRTEHEPAAPAHDPEVEAWLRRLFGAQYAAGMAWIACCAPARRTAQIPALTLLDASGVGKTLLACGISRALGASAPVPLGKVLGRFRSPLLGGGIVFGDEGMPRIEGKPATQEFRDFVTLANHAIEMKGTDVAASVSGHVPVILAANRVERLALDLGELGENDVKALLRRLLVVRVRDNAQAEDCARLSAALGGFDGDPVRLARVAGHVAWIMDRHRASPTPQADAGSLEGYLRAGSEKSQTAINALEDLLAAGSVYVAPDEAAGLLWYQPGRLAEGLRPAMSAEGFSRALGSYVVRASEQRRTHPVTGEAYSEVKGGRVRWAAVSLAQLREHGWPMEGPESDTPPDLAQLREAEAHARDARMGAEVYLWIQDGAAMA